MTDSSHRFEFDAGRSNSLKVIIENKNQVIDDDRLGFGLNVFFSDGCVICSNLTADFDESRSHVSQITVEMRNSR